MKSVIVAIAFLSFSVSLFAQVLLNADGPGNTYELINSVLAPTGTAVEPPDCSHESFGRHITEEWDTNLQAYVFVFYIHVTPDNDRCINFDRQRNEIKTYDKSPDNLKAAVGETITYKWKFKIDAAFQASSKFTHLHQIKAVGGSEEDMPLITFTARKGTPDKLELRYAETLTQETLKDVNLSLFKGVWVEATETITFGEQGKYQVSIKKVSDNTEIFAYSNNSIRMWKTDADFLRPKWGIYRSLDDAGNLRDEQVRFANFSITENLPGLIPKTTENTFNLNVFPNPITNLTQISYELPNDAQVRLQLVDVQGKLLNELMDEYSSAGKHLLSLDKKLEKGVYFVRLDVDGAVAMYKIIGGS
jgi:hypothetical protein